MVQVSQLGKVLIKVIPSLTNSDFVISLPDTAAAIVTVAIRILQTIKMPFKIA